MNPVLDVMRDHRSVRHFTPDPVPEDDLRQAVCAAQCASTSSAIRAPAFCAPRIGASARVWSS